MTRRSCPLHTLHDPEWASCSARWFQPVLVRDVAGGAVTQSSENYQQLHLNYASFQLRHGRLIDLEEYG
jgi:hypothetical protein